MAQLIRTEKSVEDGADAQLEEARAEVERAARLEEMWRQSGPPDAAPFALSVQLGVMGGEDAAIELENVTAEMKVADLKAQVCARRRQASPDSTMTPDGVRLLIVEQGQKALEDGDVPVGAYGVARGVTLHLAMQDAAPAAARRQVIPPVPSLSTLLRPYLAHFPPFSFVFCAFSPSRRGGSNEPQARTQGQETTGTRAKRGELPPSFDAPDANQRINWQLRERVREDLRKEAAAKAKRKAAAAEARRRKLEACKKAAWCGVQTAACAGVPLLARNRCAILLLLYGGGIVQSVGLLSIYSDTAAKLGLVGGIMSLYAIVAALWRRASGRCRCRRRGCCYWVLLSLLLLATMRATGHVLLEAGRRLDTGQLEAQGVQACPSTTHIWPVTFKASNSTSEDDAELSIVLYAPSREVQSKLLDGSNATAACTTLAIGTRSIDDEMAWCPTAQGVATAPLDDLGERWRHVLCGGREEAANRDAPTWCGEANAVSGSWADGSSGSWAAGATVGVSLCGLSMVAAGIAVASTALLTMLWSGCCLRSLMRGADEDDGDDGYGGYPA